MAYIVQVKNLTAGDLTYQGVIISANSYYQIPEDKRPKWAEDSDLLDDISAGNAQIGDGSQWFITTNDQINWLKGNLPAQVKAVEEPPFAAKVLPDGTKLYRRKHGITANIAANSTGIIEFNVPYSHCKLNELEVINAQEGDYVDLKVYDDPSGTISGVPDLLLNQFGYGVYLPNGFYRDVSKYDADLYINMKVKLHYYNSASSARDIYANIVVHEIKP